MDCDRQCTNRKWPPPLFQEALRATEFPANNHMWPPPGTMKRPIKGEWWLQLITLIPKGSASLLFYYIQSGGGGASIRLSDVTQGAAGGTAEQWAPRSAFILFLMCVYVCKYVSMCLCVCWASLDSNFKCRQMSPTNTFLLPHVCVCVYST